MNSKSSKFSSHSGVFSRSAGIGRIVFDWKTRIGWDFVPLSRYFSVFCFFFFFCTNERYVNARSLTSLIFPEIPSDTYIEHILHIFAKAKKTHTLSDRRHLGFGIKSSGLTYQLVHARISRISPICLYPLWIAVDDRSQAGTMQRALLFLFASF